MIVPWPKLGCMHNAGVVFRETRTDSYRVAVVEATAGDAGEGRESRRVATGTARSKTTGEDICKLRATFMVLGD